MPKIKPQSQATASREADDWVFLAMFRCESCERSVTWKHGGGDGFDPRAYRNLRVCPSCSTRASA